MSSDDAIITLGDAIIYLRMSDFRDADGMTFAERADQLRTFAIGLGVPAGPHPGRDRERRGQRRRVPARLGLQAAGPGHHRDRPGHDADPPTGVRPGPAGPTNRKSGGTDLR